MHGSMSTHWGGILVEYWWNLVDNSIFQVTRCYVCGGLVSLVHRFMVQ